MGAKKPTYCHLCGQKIQGTYFTYDTGLVACQHCNDSIPHCSRCNLPSRQLTKVRGVLICPACRQKAPVCPSCHEPILDRAFTYDGSSVRYCETCVLTRSHCDICRVPLDEHGKTFPGKDGPSYRCAICLRSAVTQSGEAERLYHQAYTILRDELQLEIPQLPRLNIVERVQLAGLNHQTGTLNTSNTPIGAESQHLLGFFKRVNDERTVYIERLLPQTLFLAVAAHELAHAWQSFHAPTNQPLEIVEGFAEWVAYRVLLKLGEQKEAAHLTRRDDLYGRGLQRFIQLERQYGRQGVLQQARQ